MQFMIPRTIFFQTIYNKAVFRFGFVISEIIKVEVSVIRFGFQLG